MAAVPDGAGTDVVKPGGAEVDGMIALGRIEADGTIEPGSVEAGRMETVGIRDLFLRW